MYQKHQTKMLAAMLFLAVLLSYFWYHPEAVQAKETPKIGVTSVEEFYQKISELVTKREKKTRIIVKGEDGAKIRKELEKQKEDMNRFSPPEDPYAGVIYAYPDFYKPLRKYVKKPDHLLIYYCQSYELDHVKTVSPDLEEFYLYCAPRNSKDRGMFKKLPKVIKKVKKIVKSWDLKNLTDYQRIAKVNDYVCNLTTYDHEAALSLPDVTSYEPFEAYGALFNRRSVCEGYTQLTDMLLKEIGYECIAGLGRVEVYHIWNEVKIDGKYYMLDTTFNDGNNRTAYFLVGTNEMKSHPYTKEFELKNHAKSRLSSSSKISMKLDR